ncbi:TPA: inverse autotransporter beta domain-containing protein [Citrobacter pasteurii]
MSKTIVTPGIRRQIWFNITMQAAFPLAVAFAPVMAGAGEQHFLQQPAPLSAQRKQVYTLGAGESVASVAKKYNLTVAQLRNFNQFRTFSHGFDHLQQGDELDVPVIPLPEVRWENDASDTDAAEHNNDEQMQKVAGYASQAGNFLSSGASGDAAASMARGMATGEAGGALQQWLSRFGTARVQLDADKHFSLKNSQFDLLLPLYEQQDRIVFTQGSLHRTDSRTQANLGAGIRHFYDSWMFGANSFVDYDLSRDHARAGAGLEYWRDFLKLGFNGYTHLTGWKDSPDLDNYQERPANGWDIRAQAWLPSLPQLGGKLTYEQYYGNEVALFGVDNRQKNPHAITAGVNYTPVPLISLGAEQRQGESGKNDTRLTLDMNYQLGVPWRSQLNPDAVAAMRSLIGSRYDLVERNNNIVLEYRKKEVLRLHTADLITGKAGEQKSLQVSVTSTYGLSRIDWDAPALNAAGGKIVQNGSDYVVVLPPYLSAAQAVNTYTVSGIAVDTKGNRSDRSDTQVTVQASEVNKQTFTFTPVNSVLPADGKSTQILTLTLLDANNQAVDIDVKDISLKNSALKSATVSALTRNSAGVYTVTVTAGTDVENVTLTPTVSGTTLTSAEVTINSDAPVQSQSAISTDKTSYASGTDMTVTVTLKDAAGSTVTGATALLTADTVKVTNASLRAGSTWKDNNDGTYSATYTAGMAGDNLKATVKLAGWSNADESQVYAIYQQIEAPGTIETQINPYSYSVNKVEGDFPTVGFMGATFTIKPKNNANASDYVWSTDTSWVAVTDGVVELHNLSAQSKGDKVTITGKPKTNIGNIIEYSFTLKSWFIFNHNQLRWADASAACNSESGNYNLSTVQQLNGSASQGSGTRGTLGGLWSEWGNPGKYNSVNNNIADSWSSDQAGSGSHYGVYMLDGKIGPANDDVLYKGASVCHTAL